MPCDVRKQCLVSHLRRSFVMTKLLIHALTGVAIACRPFGPLSLNINEKTPMEANDKV
jgi:hypothetical protein